MSQWFWQLLDPEDMDEIIVEDTDELEAIINTELNAIAAEMD